MKRNVGERFLYRLALATGTWDVASIRNGMTAKAFRRWLLYSQVEPFRFDKELRQDFRIASIVQVIANVNRGKNQRAYTIKDFLLQFDDDEAPKERKKTWQEMQKIAYMIAAAYNADGITS